MIPYSFSAAAGVIAIRAGSTNYWLRKIREVLFSRAFDTGNTAKKTVYPAPADVRHHAALLDDLGLLQPALIKNDQISSIHHRAADGTNVSGWCESIVPGANDTLVAFGWAALNAAGRPADGV